MSAIAKILPILFIASILLWSTHAAAFCGMYVSKKEDAELLNEATQVVLFRDGLTTAVTMQNSYKGPVDDFAMLVPVPQVLEKKDVETLDPDTMSRLATFTSPRLSAYEKRVRCNGKSRGVVRSSGTRKTTSRKIDLDGIVDSSVSKPSVAVRASFHEGEYEIKVLEASDSTGLLDWLERESYNIPKGGEELLQGYINAGMYFFVAKVDATRVTFDKKGRAELSPLRFSYSSEDFSLPVRLGMVNADGPQDLLIHTISPQGRYESSNYLTGIMPTNLIVQSKVQKNFASFYTSLYKRVRTKQEATLMTEFVGMGGRQKCDPCTSTDTALSPDMLVPFISSADATYDLRYNVSVQIDAKERGRYELISRITEDITQLCYNRYRLVIEGKRAMNATQRFTIDMDEETGKFTWKFGTDEGFDALSETQYGALKTCVENALDSLSENKTFENIERGTHAAEIAFTYSRSRQITSDETSMLYKAVVTRMRGTFSSKETTEDIVFALDVPLAGGYGEPELEDDAMTHFYNESEGEPQRFQARYIIIQSDIDDQIKKCSKVLGWSVYWTNPSKGTFETEPMSMTKKPKFSVKQLRRLIQNEKQAGLDL